MLNTVSGPVIWVVGVLTAVVVGAVTFLANAGTVTGQDAMTVYTVVLTGVVGVGTAHVAGQAVAQNTANQTAATAAPPTGPVAAAEATAPYSSTPALPQAA